MTLSLVEDANKIRTLLVDDNVLFRNGLASLLSAQPDFSVVGQLRGGKEAVQACLSMEPDLIMLDILQFGTSGIDTVAQIKRRQPKVSVILLTNFRNEEYVRAALEVGTDGSTLGATLSHCRLVFRGDFALLGVSHSAKGKTVHLLQQDGRGTATTVTSWRPITTYRSIAPSG